eukprot:7155073-Ditylum_brightwellii.AAC.1
MAVHPLCEVWSSPHQEHILRMCDAGMGEENRGEKKSWACYVYLVSRLQQEYTKCCLTTTPTTRLPNERAGT